METGSVAELIAAADIWFGIAAMIAVDGYRGPSRPPPCNSSATPKP